ncbi:undecaprenyl-phosphate glucose phosphotransferase [Thalassotalea aquiviva]|uniref:undecaprenyl-phosphate glucose phosphotransferase n=1 Tax=Thalassotalea aquiviva TaxID=3242415 RepID=UPI00352B3116
MDIKELKQEHKSFVWLFHKASDLFAILGAWVLVIYLYSDYSLFDKNIQLLMFSGLALSLAYFEFFKVYRHWRGESAFKELITVLIAWISTVFSLELLSYYFVQSVFQELILYWGVTAGLTLMFIRFSVRTFLKYVRSHGRNLRHVVLIGDNAAAVRAYKTIKQAPWNGYSLIGYFSSSNSLGEGFLGSIDKINEWFEQNGKNVDQIWLSELPSHNKTNEVLESLQIHTTSDIRYLPDLTSFNLINHSFSSIEGLAVINVCTSPLNGVNRLLKSIEDKVIAAIILLLISPIMLFLALGVKLSSPGPIFYRQERVGLNGKTFQMLKFRSMGVDSEKNGVQWGGAATMSVTPFGRFIRSTSLDELPQFINVLKGDMSIVGPRPERTVFVEQFKHEIPNYMQKHMVKAGITGLAQIQGWRGDTDLNKRIESDIEYIRNWSVLLDLKIIFLTIFKGFINPNAK